MNNKFKLLSLVFCLALLLNVSGVYAWGPTDHTDISNEALNDPQLSTSNIAQIIKSQKPCFQAGYMITDVTVIYYYTSGAKYEATHSWNFQRRMLETAEDSCEQAFAYGIAAHLVQDSVSHNIFIPEQIRATLVPNYVIHPIKEAISEAHIIATKPQSFEEMRRSLDILYNQRPDLIDKVQDAVYASSGESLNIKALTDVLREAIASPDGFYSSVFALPSIYKSVAEGNIYVGLILGAITFVIIVINFRRLKNSKKNIIFSFSWVPIAVLIYLSWFFAMGGLVGSTDVSGVLGYREIAIDRTIEIFQPNGWNTRFIYEPTGFTKLAEADSEVIIIDLAVIAFFASAYIIYTKFIRKRKRK